MALRSFQSSMGCLLSMRGLNATKYLLYCNGVMKRTLTDLKLKYVYRLKKSNGY